MAIYSKDGIQLALAFGKNGDSLQSAYGVNGDLVFSAGLSELKVMTYNVGGWYIGSGRNVPASKEEEYYALQTGMILANDPDVLVIQEYLANFSDSGTSALSMLQSLFPYVHAKVSGTYFGRAICSKYPITDYVERTFTQEPSRYFDSCIVTINGTEIPFVNTHLGLTQANRTPEIAQLIQFLESLDKFVCCGDFNTEMVTETANAESEEYINNVKPFVDAGFHTANFGQFGFMMTYQADTWYMYLDNIYTSHNIPITGAYVDTTKLTDEIVDTVDHMPLIAELSIGAT